MSLTKAARARRKARDRQRAYRARKAAEADGRQPFNLEDQPPTPPAIIEAAKGRLDTTFPTTTWTSIPAVPLPPLQAEADGTLFDTAEDIFRPIWWDEVDPAGTAIKLNLEPRDVRKNPTIVAADGPIFIEAEVDGFTYNESGGFVDVVAKLQEEADKAAEKERRLVGR